MGRVGSFLRQDDAGWTDAQLLQRDELAHSLMYLTRGQPVVYYGDEQGFSAPKDVPGGIGDQRAREDMFPSKVALHNAPTTSSAPRPRRPTPTSTPPTRSTSTSPTSPTSARSTRRSPTARRCTVTPQGARHLRLQPDGCRRAGRVRRRRQQRDDRPDGHLRHLPAAPAPCSRRSGRPRPRATSRPTPRVASPSRCRRCRRSSTRRTRSCGATASGRCRRSPPPVTPASSPAAPRWASPFPVATSPR